MNTDFLIKCVLFPGLNEAACRKTQPLFFVSIATYLSKIDVYP